VEPPHCRDLRFARLQRSATCSTPAIDLVEVGDGGVPLLHSAMYLSCHFWTSPL
jgi:hypothetical protein